MTDQTGAAPESVADRTLTLTRVIDAPPHRVFEAWTTPELMKQFFAPKPWTTPHIEVDPRPGGRSNVTMRSPEGEDSPNEGVYLEVVPNKKIVFTDAFTAGWLPVSGMPFMVATIELEDAPGGKTKYTATARHWSIASTKQHQEMGFHSGWGQVADQLNELLQRKL